MVRAALTNTVGRTTVLNKNEKDVGSPAMIKAESKNVAPLINVPKILMVPTAKVFIEKRRIN